jgi:hypothetical protein
MRTVVAIDPDIPIDSAPDRYQFAIPLIEKIISIGADNRRVDLVAIKEFNENFQRSSRFSGTSRHIENAALGAEKYRQRFVLMPPFAIPLRALSPLGLMFRTNAQQLLFCCLREAINLDAQVGTVPERFEMRTLTLGTRWDLPGRIYVDALAIVDERVPAFVRRSCESDEVVCIEEQADLFVIDARSRFWHRDLDLKPTQFQQPRQARNAVADPIREFSVDDVFDAMFADFLPLGSLTDSVKVGFGKLNGSHEADGSAPLNKFAKGAAKSFKG